MIYELAKKLELAGFPKKCFIPRDGECGFDRRKEATRLSGGGFLNEGYYFPTLSELIEACGGIYKDEKYGVMFFSLSFYDKEDTWFADYRGMGFVINRLGLSGKGTTPEEAVAKLWLNLYGKN